MGFLTTEERVRVRIAHLVRHGDAVKIAEYSAKRRAPQRGLSAQNLSYFLNGRRKRPLGISDLEDIAFYFNLTVGDLFTPRKKTELAGAEQRLLVAYAAAPPEVQAAVLTMLEAADRGRSRGGPRRRFSGGHAIAALATRPAPDLLDAI
jgi:transcriptional regulator with XRE-family HTH domain